MAKPKFSLEEGESSEEYEILPHHEIEELKEELRRLKEFEITPSKKMHVTMIELNHKLDKLITIFEDAMHEVRVEEGGLKFADKMRPVMEKMNKVLEQNSEIASGILAVADMVKEIKGKPEPITPEPPMFKEEEGLPPLPGSERTPPMGTPPPLPEPTPQPPGPIPPVTPPGMPPPPPPKESPLPPPPRRRSFGL